MRVVALIPARSGSKGLAHKNIKPLNGKPLMNYAIDAALHSHLVNDVYVSSDSREYLNIAQRAGAKTLLREPVLAGGSVPIKPVVKDFLGFLGQQGIYYDALVLLYPTYPLRTSDDIDSMVKMFEYIKRPLVGIKKPATHPYRCYKVKDTQISQVMDFDINRHYRRQSYPEVWEITHFACVIPTAMTSKLDNQLLHKSTYPLQLTVDPHKLIDVDSEWDFHFAEYVMQKLSPVGCLS